MVYRQIIYPGSGRVSGQHLCTENKHRETIFVKKRSSGAQSLYGKEASDIILVRKRRSGHYLCMEKNALGHKLCMEKKHRGTILLGERNIGTSSLY